MGASTFAVGLLPTFHTIGWAAPTLLTILRLVQGLALGGEYGGAATYVAEHAPNHRRGFDTSWIQTTATLGLLLALIVIAICRGTMAQGTFALLGWRVPFIISLLLLVFSIYIRLALQESPVFLRMKAEGRGSKRPLIESFLRYPNNKLALLALLGATAGQGVVWYTGQFWAIFFLGSTLKLDYVTVYMLVGASLILGTPFFIFFGWLSDRVGRLKIILAGCLIAALTYVPIFKALTHYVNPALEAFQDKTVITVAADDCHLHVFVGPWTTNTPCDNAKDALTKLGVAFNPLPGVPGADVVTRVGDAEFRGWDKAVEKKVTAALKERGYPSAADPDAVNWPMTILLLFIMVLYVTMVYGPIAAYLVELFPVKIRYSSMSLPYHIGNGWFGGMLPLLATALMVSSGDIYRGLWYPIIVALLTLVIGAVFLRDTPKEFDIRA
jgi:MFS family permease